MNDPQKKQELEQHEVTEVLRFLKKYGKYIGTGAAAALAVFLLITLNIRYEERRDATAEALLREAQTTEQLREIVRSYPKTSIAPVVLLDLAKTSFNNGNYSEARSAYEEFLRNYPKSDLRATAEFGLAHCTEADEKFDAAAEEFKRFLSEYPNHYLSPPASLGLARSLKRAGRTDEAQAVLEAFFMDHGNSPIWLEQAERALMDLNQNR